MSKARSHLEDNSPYAMTRPYIINLLKSIDLENIKEDELQLIWSAINKIL
jgi:hypothetical protein